MKEILARASESSERELVANEGQWQWRRTTEYFRNTSALSLRLGKKLSEYKLLIEKLQEKEFSDETTVKLKTLYKELDSAMSSSLEEAYEGILKATLHVKKIKSESDF